jgi:hypothetical protein
MHEDPDPIPRPDVSSREEAAWPATRRLWVPELPLPDVGFWEVARSRRSRRKLVPAPLRETLGWLNVSTQPAFAAEYQGLPRTKTPSISAGALSSITPLLLLGRGHPRLLRPQPLEAAAEFLRLHKAEPLLALRARAREALPTSAGCDLVLLVCDMAKLDTAYEAAKSLGWRDAGAMLQTLGLTATAAGLGFCPLALLGGEVRDALAIGPRFESVGVAVVGL